LTSRGTEEPARRANESRRPDANQRAGDDAAVGAFDGTDERARESVGVSLERKEGERGENYDAEATSQSHRPPAFLCGVSG